TSRRRETKSRLDQRRSGHHKIVATVRPAWRAAVRALSREKRRANSLSGVVDQKHGPGETRNRRAQSRVTIKSREIPRGLVSSVIRCADRKNVGDDSALRENPHSRNLRQSSAPSSRPVPERA